MNWNSNEGSTVRISIHDCPLCWAGVYHNLLCLFYARAAECFRRGVQGGVCAGTALALRRSACLCRRELARIANLL